jgi:hypothetical protein
VSGLEDTRVLSAFQQGIQRPYMIGVEQRLGNIAEGIDTLSTRVDALELRYMVVDTTGSFTTTSTTYVDTGISATIRTYDARPVVVWFSVDDFWISSTVISTAYLAISVDGGTDYPVSMTYKAATTSNTYGAAGSAVFLGSFFGTEEKTRTFKLRAKTSAGTLYVGAGSSNKISFVAVQL